MSTFGNCANSEILFASTFLLPQDLATPFRSLYPTTLCCPHPTHWNFDSSGYLTATNNFKVVLWRQHDTSLSKALFSTTFSPPVSKLRSSGLLPPLLSSRPVLLLLPERITFGRLARKTERMMLLVATLACHNHKSARYVGATAFLAMLRDKVTNSRCQRKIRWRLSSAK